MAKEIKLEGVKEMKAVIKAIRLEQPKRVKRALIQIAERVMRRSKREFVPVDTGTLKNSGHVEPDPNPNKMMVALVYGGPAAKYAIDQHENPKYVHPGGRSWKYLEIPLMQEVPNMAREIAAKAQMKK